MKKLLVIVLLVLMMVVLSSHSFAAVRIDGVTISSGSQADTSKVNIYFSGDGPFDIYRSLDGQEWSALDSGVVSNEYTDDNRINYVNYYYKVEDNANNSAVVIAYPPNENPHGSFAINSSFCACCHVTHAADGAYLLGAPNAVALCTTCHDGTQSKYDVRSGKVTLPFNRGREDTSGGPFGPLLKSLPVEIAVYSAAYESTSSTEVDGTPTSIHNLGHEILTAPGGISTKDKGLGCTDCHDAHGNGNFRNLKTVIQVTEGLSSTINFRAFAQTDVDNASEYGEKIYYQDGSINFCSACHSDYNQASGSGSIAAVTTQQQGFPLSAASTNMYMHAVNTPLIWRGEYLTTSLPMENGTGVNVIVCLTCHYSHGTVKQGLSKATTSTALIRLDKQAVCEECHKK